MKQSDAYNLIIGEYLNKCSVLGGCCECISADSEYCMNHFPSEIDCVEAIKNYLKEAKDNNIETI